MTQARAPMEAARAGDGIEIDETAVSGTVRFSGFRSSDAEEELLQATLDAFSEKYPNIEVDYEPIPEGYIEQMTAQFSAGEPPDLFYVQAEFADAWIEDGLLEPLDPYFAGNPEFDTGPFFDPLIQAFEFEGQTYGLPKDASPLALFYNPDMLEAAGVEPPTTWEELEAAAEALTTDDVYGLCLGAELPRVGALMYQSWRRHLQRGWLGAHDRRAGVGRGDRRRPRDARGRNVDVPRRHRRRLVRRGVRPGAGRDDDGGQLAGSRHGERLHRHAVRDRGAAAGHPAGQPRVHGRVLDRRRFGEQGGRRGCCCST